MTDEKYMVYALKLAARGLGRVSPNPAVGALVVKDGRIIGEGYHMRAGTPHAEIHALDRAGEKARGATLYVTLEPCCHYGRTPPCTKRIIAAGISRVVVAVEDPNPLVAGKGLAELREAGIDVTVGTLAEKARRLNEVFFKFIGTGRPFVILKAAASLDGKLATWTSDSQWITGEKARTYAHYLRSLVDAVLVGVRTVLTDDPLLNIRLVSPRKEEDPQPYRIIVDTRARTPLTARVVREHPEKTIIALTAEAPREKVNRLKAAGVKIWELPLCKERVSLPDLLARVGAENITSLLVEGGGEINAGFLEEKLVDKLYLFLAPKIVGGETAPSWVQGRGADRLSACRSWKRTGLKVLGQDLLLEFYPPEE